MDLQHWQAQFENWLKNHHQHQDAAHDVCHFRRVWATAQKLAADDDVDMLVILTACYFHDIVSLAKNHPQRQRSSILAAEETRRLLREEFEQFPAEKIEAVCHAMPPMINPRIRFKTVGNIIATTALCCPAKCSMA
jgi:uncharacterized protein